MCFNNKLPILSPHFGSTRGWNHLNHSPRRSSSIPSPPFTTPSIFDRRSSSPWRNSKSSRASMILKVWVLRLYKYWIRLVYNSQWRTRAGAVPPSRSRQPNSTTSKHWSTNINYRRRRYSLMNNSSSRRQSRRHPGAAKSNRIYHPTPRRLLWTVFRNLWSKSLVYTDCGWSGK